MAELMTIEEVAAYFRVYPGSVRQWIASGYLRARRDGLISQRASTAYIHRQQRISRHYLQLWDCGKGLPAKKAWALAVQHETKRQRSKR